MYSLFPFSCIYGIHLCSLDGKIWRSKIRAPHNFPSKYHHHFSLTFDFALFPLLCTFPKPFSCFSPFSRWLILIVWRIYTFRGNTEGVVFNLQTTRFSKFWLWWGCFWSSKLESAVGWIIFCTPCPEHLFFWRKPIRIKKKSFIMW